MPDSLKTELQKQLEGFADITDLPVAIYSADGELVWECTNPKRICDTLIHDRQYKEICKKNISFSAKQCEEMGEPYIYTCPSGLIHIAVSLLDIECESEVCVVGPIAMGKHPDQAFGQLCSLRTVYLESLVHFSKNHTETKIYTMQQVERAAALIYSVIQTATKNWKQYQEIHTRYQQHMTEDVYLQQSQTEDANDGTTGMTIAEIEQQLFGSFLAREHKKATDCMRRLVKEIIMVEGSNFDGAKLRMLQIQGGLIGLAVKNGGNLEELLSLTLEQNRNLGELSSLRELETWAQSVVDYFSFHVFQAIPQYSNAMQSIIDYINMRYGEKITLQTLATTFSFSEAQISRMFRQEMVTTMTDYLNRIRIDRSKELMLSSNWSVLDIAGMVGFDDQSYFTKVFKRYEGISPRAYRKNLLDGSDKP